MELAILEFLEADYAYEKLRRKRRRMQLRKRFDPFNICDNDFVKRYGLTKELTSKLCDEIRSLMTSPKRSSDLTVETKVLIALSFYTSGSFQRCNRGQFVAQSTVSSCISQVTACLNLPEICNKYIKFPSTEEGRHKNRVEFYDKFKIPGVLGCIYNFNIPIVRPVQDDERYHTNNIYSLNVQLICDANKQILNVDATNGGATSDSEIWNNNPLRIELEELNKTENNWILGNSNYTSSKTIKTPTLAPELNIEQTHTNKLHNEAMSSIKSTIESLRTKFRCLNGQKVLHYSPDVAGSIVIACCVINNFCIQ